MTETLSQRSHAAFISSTARDLTEHRAAIFDACLRVGVQPLAFENFAADADSLTRANELLDRADVYIGILAFRYGMVPPGQEKSLTEIEFERARARGIPCLLFAMSEEHPVRVTDVETGPGAEKLRQFKALVRRELLVQEFRSPDELKAAVVTGLVEVFQDQSRRREPASALLLLPFGPEREELRDFLSSVLEHLGVRVLRLDHMITHDATLTNKIADAIRSASFIMVDVTGANPNVMYELGYVHALKKPTIILSDSGELGRIPSYIVGFQYLAYEKGHLDRLRLPIERFVHEYMREARR